MFNRKQIIHIILKHLLRAGLAVIIALVITNFLGAKISKISNSLNAQRTSAYILEKRIEAASLLRDQFKIVGDNDKKIDDAFPPVDDISGFIATLESVANQNSVQQNLVFSTPLGDSIDYTINLNGNITTWLNYLKGFEKLPYFTAISSLGLNAQNGNWETNSTISMKARVYTE